MNQCPKCKNKMRVTHTYSIGEKGRTQRLYCEKCHTVATAVALVVNIDPEYGQGAAKLAKKIRESNKKPVIET